MHACVFGHFVVVFRTVLTIQGEFQRSVRSITGGETRRFYRAHFKNKNIFFALNCLLDV